MLPVYSPDSHADFQEFFVSNFLKFYPDPFSLSRQTWKVIVQFWHMDLSQTEQILMDSYSKMGPMPRQPSSMLRSYLLSLKLKVTSVTDWVSKLKECPLYAILSGFSPGDVPGEKPSMTSSGICGTRTRNIFPLSSAIKRRELQKVRNTEIKLLISRIRRLSGLSASSKSILSRIAPAVRFL